MSPWEVCGGVGRGPVMGHDGSVTPAVGQRWVWGWVEGNEGSVAIGPWGVCGHGCGSVVDPWVGSRLWLWVCGGFLVLVTDLWWICRRGTVLWWVEGNHGSMALAVGPWWWPWACSGSMDGSKATQGL